MFRVKVLVDGQWQDASGELFRDSFAAIEEFKRLTAEGHLAQLFATFV